MPANPVRPIGRSPDYPGLSLKAALERAQQVHAKFLNHPMPSEDVRACWGYSPKSGPGLVALGALKRFGLMVAQGRGEGSTVSLTSGAYAYFEDEREDQSERIAFIKKAALLPAIHKEIFAKYGASPKADVLKHYLKTERAFTSSGADGLISEYAETMAFAGLVESDTLAEDAGDETPDRGETAHGAHSPPPRRPKERAMAELQETSRDLTILLTGGRMAILRAPVEISDEDYKLITGQLDAMKAAFITMAANAPEPPAVEQPDDDAED